MKIIIVSFFLVLLNLAVNAQSTQDSTSNKEIEAVETDSVFNDTIHLEEIVIYRGKVNQEDRKQFELLRNRVYITYPYAKLASERLTFLNKGMASLKTNKDKKKIF